jgi:acetyl-CoA C-acetyltransferase
MVDEVIMGNVVSAGIGQAPARQAAIYGDIPPSAAALTINKVCGSGLKSVVLGARAVSLGDADFVVAGGMESMSNAPYTIPRARQGLRMGNGSVVDLMIQDGLWDAYGDMHMGITGELVAEKYGISRETQDEYAFNSHMKAVAAIDNGLFEDEIVTVEVPQRKGEPIEYRIDETVRRNTTIERLARLRPAFKKDGTVTAGNAPGVNDGASAVVVTSGKKAEELGLKPIARILGYSVGGVEPQWVMMAPVDAVKKLEKKIGMTPDDFDLIELNEAFSVQAIAVMSETGMNPEKVNVNGGAVALGHAIGSSGSRILVTLMYALMKRKGKYGLATLCLGGGNAVALAIEMM